MGNCVTGSSKIEYINKNIRFMMWGFDKSELTKTLLIAPLMVGVLNISHHRDENNIHCLNFRKVRKVVLYSVSVEDNNFTILMHCLTFEIFPGI